MIRVATHHKVKIPWFFTDILKTKLSMFTLALASFASYRYCYLQFQTLSTFYGILSTKHLTSHTHNTYKSILFFFLRKLLTTPNTCVRHRVSKWLVSLLWSIHLVIFTRKCIEKACRKLISYKLEMEFPDFSLTLKNLFFPHFSLTVATLLRIARKISLAILTWQSNIFTWRSIETMPQKN